MSPRFSVLDLVPVSRDQSSGQAIESSLRLAQLADAIGYERYWFAEHHNSLAGASATPAVTIAAALGRTKRIRLGAGGVMLPNHSPLIVAEQFAALEAIAPGRIDLGLGRAPGSDRVIAQILLYSGPTSDPAKFPESVSKIVQALQPGGAMIHLAATETYEIHATARATSAPPVWVLGGSEGSAALAASLGLPYAFAGHFGATNPRQIIDMYRSRFRPSDHWRDPYALITANVSVAATREEAEMRAVPQLLHLAGLRLGHRPEPMHTVESARAALRRDESRIERQLVAQMRSTWLGGTGEDVADALDALVRESGADEVMLHSIAGRREGDPLDLSVGRAQTLELIAKELGVRVSG
ncbi:MAG: LLM class flavin-dependent oxidoreductase [Pseudonocardiaceae bacterium]